MPSVTDLAGTILLLETSEDLSAADEVKRWVRALGERDVLGAVAGILVARSPVSELGSVVPSANERTRCRDAQRETIIEQVTRYNPDAVICVGAPFRHTRPQWIIPHGGTVRLNRTASTAPHRLDRNAPHRLDRGGGAVDSVQGRCRTVL